MPVQEPVVLTLELLQAYVIRLRLFRPSQQDVQAAVDAFDIVSRDLHYSCLNLSWTRR